MDDTLPLRVASFKPGGLTKPVPPAGPRRPEQLQRTCPWGRSYPSARFHAASSRGRRDHQQCPAASRPEGLILRIFRRRSRKPQPPPPIGMPGVGNKTGPRKSQPPREQPICPRQPRFDSAIAILGRPESGFPLKGMPSAVTQPRRPPQFEHVFLARGTR